METSEKPAIVLVPGHWLGAWAWERVTPALTAAGHRVVPVTLPGLDPDDPQRSSRTLDDQAEALLALVDDTAQQTGGPVVLVAHSGANGPASVVLDRRPELVSHMIWVDSGPVADGTAFAADLPEQVVEVPLPPFDELGRQASLDGLAQDTLDRFRERAVSEPGPVMRQPVRLGNEARREVSTTLVCSSFPAEQVQQMARAGHPMMAEVALLRDVEFVDLPTGHWPMWSRPEDLAQAIVDAAGGR